MQLLQDGRLKRYLENMEYKNFKERDLMKELVTFLNSPNDARVMMLYGLRRTGKLTMMLQAIDNHIGIDNVLYIRCKPYDKIEDISEVIFSSEKKYIFLDEVTRVPDFISLSSAISDEAAFSGHKIVMAGTDSLGFMYAKRDELFDRTHEIHTTYISFAEYNRLTGKNLFEYMKYGGTLSPENYFYNDDNLNEYTNRAIVQNIMHTLKYWKDGDNDCFLYPAVKEEDILSLINYYLRENSKLFIAERLKKFKASEYLSSAQMFESKMRRIKKHPEIYGNEYIPNPEPLYNEELANELQKNLMIEDDYPFEIDNTLLSRIRDMLLKLDVLTYVKETKQYYFTQPGMRYCHIRTAIDTLCDNKDIREKYSQKDIDIVSDKIMQDTEGRLIEEIIFLNLKKHYADNDNIEVSSFSNINGEYDITVSDRESKKSCVFEVKRSADMAAEQKRYLTSKVMADSYEDDTGYKIVGRAVIYSGDTGVDEEGFTYLNSSTFLVDTDEILEKTFPALGDMIKKEETFGKSI